MAGKTTPAGFPALLDELKSNNGASYADIKARAGKKGLTIYPVMFGRAKAMLGLVKSAKRGQGKFAEASAAKRDAARPKAGGGDGSKSEQIRESPG